MPSLAFKRSKNGKLTFDRDPVTRDYKRDEFQVYAVLRTIAMTKGSYYFGGPSDGTVFGTIITDRLTTGSQFVAACRDGLQQVQQQGLIIAGTPTATRLGPGHWEVIPRYRAGGQERAERLRVA